MGKKGLTLIELLIAIAIIAILGAVIVAAVNPLNQLKKARDTQRKTALKQIQNALEQYFQDNGSYPTISCYSGATGTCWSVANGVSNLLGTNAANYLPSMPTDPRQAQAVCTNSAAYGYQYVGVAGGTSYTLTTRLEVANDPQRVTGPIGGCYWGGTPADGFNYSLTNQQ